MRWAYFGTARAHIPLRGIMSRRSLRIPSPMICTVVQATHTGDCIRCQKRAQLPPQTCSEAGEPTGAREHVCGPDVILTASVKGAREISAGRSPLAQQVARAVRARQNHVGGVPANCGLVSPERSEPRSGRYAGCEQVGAGLDINRITRKRFNGLESHLFW